MTGVNNRLSVNSPTCNLTWTQLSLLFTNNKRPKEEYHTRSYHRFVLNYTVLILASNSFHHHVKIIERHYLDGVEGRNACFNAHGFQLMGAFSLYNYHPLVLKY